LLALGVYVIYYYFSNQQTVPMTGRKQLVDISPQQEMALGLESYQQVLREAAVLRSGPAVNLVREIGQKLASVAEQESKPGFEWEFNVIQSDQVNAFCLPGGKVAVYTGIIPVAQTKDALAAVMGHEIAHAVARHGAERMAHQKLVQIGAVATQVAIGEMEPQKQRLVMAALGLGAQYGVLLPFSRDHESEADYMGLLYSARACYDPAEAPNLWVRMGQASGGGGPAEFMSTHPSHETRIRQLQEWMPKAQQERQQHCGR
jgi:predicted Zn-dependent protease